MSKHDFPPEEFEDRLARTRRAITSLFAKDTNQFGIKDLNGDQITASPLDLVLELQQPVIAQDPNPFTRSVPIVFSNSHSTSSSLSAVNHTAP